MPVFIIFCNCMKFQNHSHIIELVSLTGHTISPKNTVVKNLKIERCFFCQFQGVGELLFYCFNDMVVQFMATSRRRRSRNMPYNCNYGKQLSKILGCIFFLRWWFQHSNNFIRSVAGLSPHPDLEH